MSNRTALFSRHQPGGVFTIDDLKEHPGAIFFVDSGHSAASDTAGFGKNPDAPFATLDYAVGKCTASSGDVIYLMPGHAEAIIADSGVDIDVAGVTVIGLGKGATRPTFTFGTAVTADFKLAAASTHVENLLFLGGIDALTGPVEVSAADCAIVNCEFRDVTGQATDTLVVLDGSDRLKVLGCTFTMAAGAGANSAIAIVSSDDVEIADCKIYGNFAVGGIDLRTTASARLSVHDCRIWTANSADVCIVDTVTASTGTIGPNLDLILKDNAANITTAVTGATFYMLREVFVTNAVDEGSILINWTPVTDA